MLVLAVLHARSAPVNVDDLAEQRERFGLRALETVAPDDRAVTAAVVNPADGVEQRLVGLLYAARENDDAPAVERRLRDVLDACGEGLDRDLVGVVNLFRLGLFDERGGRLDLDDVGAELRCDLRRVRDHVERGLALLADAGAARGRPDDQRQTVRLGLFTNRARLLVHRLFLRRARVDCQSYRA